MTINCDSINGQQKTLDAFMQTMDAITSREFFGQLRNEMVLRLCKILKDNSNFSTWLPEPWFANINLVREKIVDFDNMDMPQQTVNIQAVIMDLCHVYASCNEKNEVRESNYKIQWRYYDLIERFKHEILSRMLKNELSNWNSNPRGLKENWMPYSLTALQDLFNIKWLRDIVHQKHHVVINAASTPQKLYDLNENMFQSINNLVWEINRLYEEANTKIAEQWELNRLKIQSEFIRDVLNKIHDTSKIVYELDERIDLFQNSIQDTATWRPYR